MAQRTRDVSRVGTTDNLPVSTRIALELAEQTDKAVDEIDPLADSIDPEALDRLFEDTVTSSGHVIFRHDGYQITVSADSEISIEPLAVT